MSWLLWHGKGDTDYPWRLQDQDAPEHVIHAKHVSFSCLLETDEKPGREGSHPPPFTVRIYGSPSSLEKYQSLVVMTGAPL